MITFITYTGVVTNILEGIFLILGIVCFIKYLMKRDSNGKVNKKMLGFIISICFVVTMIWCTPIMIGNYYSGYIIECNSKSDVEECKKLLEENNMDYKILFNSMSVRLQNESDFNTAINLLQENNIDFGYVVNKN